MSPEDVHRVTNCGSQTAVSLHVYAADLGDGRSSVRTEYQMPVADEVALPGARIYYETRGSGPVMLLVPGGAEDADALAPLADALASTWTVATLDPRGNSRSVLLAPPTDVDVDQHAEDAAHVLAQITSEPVVAVGTSGGAQVVLALAARHPELVRTVIAHEPPCVHVLEDPSDALAADRAVLDAYAAGGVENAIAVFAGDNDLPPMDPETFERMAANLDHFFAHGLAPISAYLPDVAALRAGAPDVVVAVGVQSRSLPIDDVTRALASLLGTSPVELPGDHMGLLTHAEECAQSISALARGQA